jgi:hypothetical protein
MGPCRTRPPARSSCARASGRLLFCGDGQTWWSDDHGASYRNSSGRIGPDCAPVIGCGFLDGECSIAELASGAVLVSFRHQPNASVPRRVEALSSDGGETFSGWRYDMQLPSPGIQAVLGSTASGQLFYGGPDFPYEQHPNNSKKVAKSPAACPQGRCHYRLHSAASPTSLPIQWHDSLSVYQGGAGYSWITPVSSSSPDTELLGISFERGYDQAPDNVSFALVEVSRASMKSDDESFVLLAPPRAAAAKHSDWELRCPCTRYKSDDANRDRRAEVVALKTEDSAALPASIYVDSHAGRDGNNGSAAAPLQTLDSALQMLKPSGTILLRNGTYSMTGLYYKDHNCHLLPPGTDDAYTTVAAQQGHRPVLAGQIGIDCSRSFDRDPGAPINSSEPHHIEFRALTIKPQLMVGYKNTTIVDCAHIDGLPYLRLVDLECGYAPDQGFFLGDCDNAQLLNLSIHHCGLICAGMSKPDFCHGIYSCQGDNVLISGCHVHHNAGEGIQIWSGDKGERMTRNVTVEYSVIHDNGNCVIPSTGEPCRGTGIGLFSGEGHSARHNIVFNNNPGISVNYNATNAVVEGNSLYNNSIGILVADIDKRLAAAVVRANQIWGSAGTSDDATASTGIWLDKTSATVEKNTLYGAIIRDDSNGTSALRDNVIVPSASGAARKTDDPTPKLPKVIRGQCFAVNFTNTPTNGQIPETLYPNGTVNFAPDLYNYECSPESAARGITTLVDTRAERNAG